MATNIFAPSDWKSVAEQPPSEGKVVITMVADSRGVRNEQTLKRKGGLWFVPDGSMYVYYTPTHWKETPCQT